MGKKLDVAIQEVKAKISRWEARRREDGEHFHVIPVSEADTVICVLQEVLEMMESIDEQCRCSRHIYGLCSCCSC